MSIITAIARLQALALTCTGMKAAPTTVPEDISAYPFSVCYPESGDVWAEGSSQSRGLHRVIVEIHAAPRAMLGEAINVAIPFITEFAYKIIEDPTLNDTVSAVQMQEDRAMRYEFGRLIWGRTRTIGIRFHLDLKIREATS